jgi:asparagine synthase (glutamine-hydrolysing)
MLWTTPESLHEKLPLVNHAGNLAITADARIDNREELITALTLNGYSSFQPINDSALILAAYEKWGEHCPEKLLGDFVFAIWDARKQSLFCARDHMGVKPFYYYVSDKAFFFATEIKALLCLSQVPRRLNELRVADYLASIFDDKASTFYQQILRLPPAHCITVTRGGRSLRSYWSLDPSAEVRLGSDKEYADAFRELFTQAVRCRLRSAFPIGSLLSGGMDSSSVTCVARKSISREDGRLYTFSAVFDQLTECDERRFINAVLAQNNVEPHYVYGDRLSPLTDLDRMLWHQDEAFYSPNLFLSWALYGAAQRRAVRVILDGFDGDTTVSHGVGYLNELARARRWLSLAIEVRGYSKTFNLSSLKLFRAYAGRYCVHPIISRSLMLKGLWRAREKTRRAGQRPPTWTAGLNRVFVERMRLEARRKTLRQTWPELAQTERETHYRLLTWGVMPFTLEVLDRAAAAFCVEPRFPFWDKRLVQFCLALPAQQKLHRGWSRVVLRRALADILPMEVQWRSSKSNLAPSFEHGLLTYDRHWLDDVILKNPSVIAEYVDIPLLRDAYRRLIGGEKTDAVLTIWKAVSLALWLQRAGLVPEESHREGG